LRSLREISTGRANLRLRFGGFFSRMWLEYACRPRSLPLAVRLKRLEAPECDFIFGMRARQYSPARDTLTRVPPLVATAAAVLVAAVVATAPAPAAGAARAPLQADPASPQLAFEGLPARVAWSRLRRGLRFRTVPSEPVRLVFVLLPSRPGGRVLTRERLPLARGARAVTLSPPARRLGRRRALTLRLRVTAVASAGGRTVAIRPLRVRP
jgi:hypothetical protein